MGLTAGDAVLCLTVGAIIGALVRDRMNKRRARRDAETRMKNWTAETAIKGGRPYGGHDGGKQ